MRHRSESQRRERAERYLERARELYIGRPGTTGFVGYDLNRALINARRALLFDPNSYEALVVMGKIVRELNESEDGSRTAVNYYDKAINLAPGRPEAYDAKALALLDGDEFRKAAEPAWKAWRLTLSDREADPFDIELSTDTLRNVLVKVGKWNLACKVLKRALKRVPNNDWLLRLLDWTEQRIEWLPPNDPAKPEKGLRRVK